VYSKALSAWLVAGALCGPAVWGQSLRENNSDSVDHARRDATVKEPDLKRVVKAVIADTNKFRNDRGRGELKVNGDLARAAQDFANFMARTDKYGHEADGKKPWQRITDHGYAYCIAAENIAWVENSVGFTTGQLAHHLFDGWKKSPPHRKNMLDEDLTEFGVAIARSSKTGRYYTVQDFGRPKALQIVFKISNTTRAIVRYRVDDKEFTLEPDYTRTHERCRSPKVTFQWPKQGQTAATEKVVHPRKGDRYVIRQSASGAFTLEKEAGL
jgi:uncharacterized protein YkwD